MSTFDYTARDFSTVKDELLLRASRSLPDWSDRDPSDFMMLLIDMWAYSADVLHFYIDRAATEAFLPTATQRESVIAMANLYGYKPSFVTSARAAVYVANTNSGASVTIPAGTQFLSNSDTPLTFYSTDPVEITAASVGVDTSAVVPVKEGKLFVEQSVTSTTGVTVSNGRPGQRFTLFHKNVDPTSLRVFVYEGVDQSPVEWQQVPRLEAITSAESAYEVYVTADNSTQIVFGNGTSGRVPPNNIQISATYAVCSGSLGNVPENAISAFVSYPSSALKVTGSTAAIGGSDSESLSQIKSAIPGAIAPQGRAVTITDYADIAQSVQGVSKAVAVYEGNAETGGSVTIYVAPITPDYLNLVEDYLDVPNSLRSDVVGTIAPISVLGVSSIAVPSQTELTPISVFADVTVKDNYVREWVKQKVERAVSSFFSFDRMQFGQTLTVGDMYRTLLDVEGVDYAIITGFSTSGTEVLDNNGKIEIDPYKLAKKGEINITMFGGVAPPT